MLLIAIAFVLLNSELGQGSKVESSLKDIAEVKEVYGVYGVYDFIVKIEMKTMSELKDIITNKIRLVRNIRSSLTMIVIE